MPNAIAFTVASVASTTAAAVGASVATQATIAAIAAAVAPTIALGVGAALIANALRPNAPAIRPSDGQVTFSAAVSGRIKSFGTIRGAAYYQGPLAA